MAKTSSLYIRIDPEVKKEVKSNYRRFGMSLTDSINIFIYQSRNVGGLPFNLRTEEGQQSKSKPEIISSMANARGKFPQMILLHKRSSRRNSRNEIIELLRSSISF